MVPPSQATTASPTVELDLVTLKIMTVQAPRWPGQAVVRLALDPSTLDATHRHLLGVFWRRSLSIVVWRDQ